jgi:hypothetical protein
MNHDPFVIERILNAPVEKRLESHYQRRRYEAVVF